MKKYLLAALIILLVLNLGGMMRIGDSMAKLAEGQQLSKREIDELRMHLNQMQMSSSQFSTIYDPTTGGIDENVWNRTYLPPEYFPDAFEFECAKVVADTQEIPNNSNTEVVFNTSATQSFNYGMSISTSGIGVSEPLDAVLLFTFFLIWESNATGLRTMDLVSEEGTHYVHGIPATNGLYTFMAIPYMRTVTSSNESNYVMNVWQNSGGALDLQGGSYISVCRIR